MGYKRITIRLVIRIILIFIMLVLLAWLITIYSEHQLFTTTLLIIVLIGLQIWELIRWLQKTNRLLFRFFEAIGQGDFMMSFNTSSSGSTHEMLLSEMNRVLDSQATRNLKQGSRIGFLEILIEHLPNGIICWGKNEKIVYQNPAAIDLLGFGTGMTWSGFFKDYPEIREMIYEAEGQKSVLHQGRKSGKKTLLKIDVWPFSILSENLRVMTIEDITTELEKKEAESWQELLRILSHEIRNSITPVSSLTETMATIIKPGQESDNKLSDQNIQDIIQAIDIIQARSVRLRIFTENVLKVTRIPLPEKTDVDVVKLLHGILQYMKGDIEENNIDVKLDIPEASAVIYADPIQFELIITNLITNSIQSLGDRSEAIIKIGISRNDDMNQIILEDNGCGIPKELVEKIFMPFFTTRKNGYGLGLSIVRQMVHLHGGSVSCESEYGEWTRFIIELPVYL